MAISLVVAASRNDVIGGNGYLPWKLPADLQRFKQLTLGHPIIMGRKTYDSIGKPLPGRTNIVITHRQDFKSPGTAVVHSLEEALQLCQNTEDVFVIGGGKIYEQALPFAERIYLPRIHQDFIGDTFLFSIDSSLWKETSRQDFPPNGNNLYPYSFILYERR